MLLFTLYWCQQSIISFRSFYVSFGFVFLFVFGEVASFLDEPKTTTLSFSTLNCKIFVEQLYRIGSTIMQCKYGCSGVDLCNYLSPRHNPALFSLFSPYSSSNGAAWKSSWFFHSFWVSIQHTGFLQSYSKTQTLSPVSFDPSYSGPDLDVKKP